MKSKKLLLELVHQVYQFEEENPHLDNLDMEGFLAFMQIKSQRLKENESVSRSLSGDIRPQGFHFQENLPTKLSRLIGLIYRYAKEYTKKALEGSDLKTVEEFSFLVILMTYQKLSKTDLILKNVMPKTSGTEVVKRLLKKNLISQFDDENDKRTQLVSITGKGLSELKKVFPQMHLASKVIVGNLSEEEGRTLVFLLEKLEAFHNDLFLNCRD